MSNLIEVKVPDIGDFSEVRVIEMLVAVGDQVSAEDPLITLESDKATMEVPAPAAGVVKEIKVALGDKVSEGAAILVLDPDGAAKGSSAPAAAASASGGSAGASTPVLVPDIGDFKDVPVIEIMVSVGAVASAEDPLVTLESDKATMEVPSPAAGKVTALSVAVGDKVSEGAQLLTLETSGAAAGAAAQSAAPAQAQKAPSAASGGGSAPRSAEPLASLRDGLPTPMPIDFAGVHASPSVRRLARELEIDLTRVAGSGDKGRITKEDVKRALGGGGAAGAPQGGMGIPPIPAVDFTKFGEIESVPMTRIKKISGPALHRSWLNIPHVTHHEEADITDVDAFRKDLDAKAKNEGYRVTLLAFLIKACCTALEEHWELNSSIAPDGEALIRKHYYHIGFAADTPHGLVVPVIHDAHKKGIVEISKELGALSNKARDGKLAPKEMSGASFTISSLGGIGGTAFTPIVNAPEVAILGVTRSKMAPVWDGKQFVPRNMLPLSLSYDHRAVDGALAARFCATLKTLLGDVRRLLL